MRTQLVDISRVASIYNLYVTVFEQRQACLRVKALDLKSYLALKVGCSNPSAYAIIEHFYFLQILPQLHVVKFFTVAYTGGAYTSD